MCGPPQKSHRRRKKTLHEISAPKAEGGETCPQREAIHETLPLTSEGRRERNLSLEAARSHQQRRQRCAGGLDRADVLKAHGGEHVTQVQHVQLHGPRQHLPQRPAHLPPAASLPAMPFPAHRLSPGRKATWTAKVLCSGKRGTETLWWGGSHVCGNRHKASSTAEATCLATERKHSCGDTLVSHLHGNRRKATQTVKVTCMAIGVKLPRWRKAAYMAVGTHPL